MKKKGSYPEGKIGKGVVFKVVDLESSVLDDANKSSSASDKGVGHRNEVGNVVREPFFLFLLIFELEDFWWELKNSVPYFGVSAPEDGVVS